MKNELRPYEKNLDVGLDWLGQIPSHWQLTSMRAITELSNERYGARNDLELLSVYREYGVILKNSRSDNHNVESQDLSNYKVVKKGYLVLNKMKMWQGSLGVSKYNGIVSPAYIVCKLIGANNEKYLHYLLRSSNYKTIYNRLSYGVRVGQWDMRYDDFKGINVLIPPNEEQDQIVKYLEYKLAKINKFIKAKKKLINLFNEQIENMVYGYDFDSKSNEINSWENIFPEEWELVKTSRLTEEVKIKNCYDKELLAVTQDRGVVYKKDCEQNYVSPSGDLSALKLVRNGDYVISLRSFQGGIEYSEIEGIVSPAYNIFKLIDDYNNEEYQKYYKALFKTRAFISLLNTVVSGIRDGKNINYSDFAKLTIPIPPIEVAKKVSKLVEQYQNFRNQFEKENVLIQEFKSSLISNVVTGKIDVRNFEIENGIEEEFDLDEEIDYEESNEFIDEGGDE